jgi:glyoxylase-like metal-dependent hydrolase (beta-lactamase superfamily II)
MLGKKRQVFSKINEDIILIHQDSMASMNFNTCNSYILRLRDNEFAIIDPGSSLKKLNKTLTQNNIDFEDIKYAYLTHGHSDHVNMLDYLQEKNPEMISYIHPLERGYVENAVEYYELLFPLRMIENQEKFSDFITAIKFYTHPNSNLTLNQNFKMVFDTWNVKSRKVDKTIKHGDVLPGGLKVIHSPGHTPGMCMLYKEQDKILFSSDIHLSKAGATVNGDKCSVAEYKKSIKNVMEMVEEGVVEILLTGHGKNPIDSNLRERLQQFYDTITKKEDLILTILQKKEKMTLEDITNATFAEYIKRFEKFTHLDMFRDTICIAEASEMMGNYNFLIELERLNKVRKEVSEDKTYWMLV